jgi:hypothetical protein
LDVSPSAQIAERNACFNPIGFWPDIFATHHRKVVQLSSKRQLAFPWHVNIITQKEAATGETGANNT